MSPGRLVEARRSLQWIRGPHCDVEEEFSRLTQSYAVTQTQKKSENRNFKRYLLDNVFGLLLSISFQVR